ncbi:MAG: DUF2189 domain-containing protein [Rhodospirillales bacterium]|nr:DUF2189 domain-containing protein [Rhodospirillales bacterium]
MEAASHRSAAGGTPAMRIRRIDAADLRAALAEGWDDFRADPTHYLFLCALYPALGLVLARAASGLQAQPLLFPLIAGFALLGPFAAVGLYELSRRREAGQEVAWWHAFEVFGSPALGGILKLGFALAGLFVLWLVAAEGIYLLTLGPAAPASAGALLSLVFTTRAGWVLLVVGNAVGFLFAAVALLVGVVSFPMMVDRHVGVEVAMQTSLQAVRANKRAMAGWGLIVAVGLVLGSAPFLLGLAVVIPVLGHATWHLYRRVVTFPLG